MTTTTDQLDETRETIKKIGVDSDDATRSLILATIYVGDCIRHLADRLPDVDAVFHPSVLRQDLFEGEARCRVCRSSRIATCLHPLEPGDVLTLYDGELRRESSE